MTDIYFLVFVKTGNPRSRCQKIQFLTSLLQAHKAFPLCLWPEREQALPSVFYKATHPVGSRFHFYGYHLTLITFISKYSPVWGWDFNRRTGSTRTHQSVHNGRGVLWAHECSRGQLSPEATRHPEGQLPCLTSNIKL